MRTKSGFAKPRIETVVGQSKGIILSKGYCRSTTTMETIMDKEKPFDVDEEEILELIKQNRIETTWSLAMEMIDKIHELSGDASLAEQYRSRYYDLYHKEAEQARKQRNETLDYFCGRHTFSPWEC